jgi:hypothetical protein
MKRLLLGAMLALTGAAGVSGCVVREREVARPGGCRGGSVWVEGRRGFHESGHWRCRDRAYY